jgi:hypothetical protein
LEVLSAIDEKHGGFDIVFLAKSSRSKISVNAVAVVEETVRCINSLVSGSVDTYNYNC